MRVTANATRSGDWWAVEVPAIPGLFTQAKRLDQVADEVIDAAAMLGEEVEAVDVEVVEISESFTANDIRGILREVLDTRAQARNAEALSGIVVRRAISAFRAEGLTVRDVAVMLQLSPQRVSVLDREPEVSPAVPGAPVLREERLDNEQILAEVRETAKRNARRVARR
ncbi:putative RNase H-like HicB family nuclease [Microbacterium marinum]|uniref:Putative RNase H-like HicB family nuclease n=1 Tax=Microbacterium marinum TaxID=421115 RepID=A0A7W7FIE1_9MICO|nr:XRE family transcriptional regulator [Microbacterium marinum]MBB4666967.1 putative RNase H-like HicB family nuclease [Microbacterium marinum]